MGGCNPIVLKRALFVEPRPIAVGQAHNSLTMSKHPAWGLAHSLRIYEMSLRLAQEQGVEVDKDALLAAAFLHDLGALGSYRRPGVDHAEDPYRWWTKSFAQRIFPPGKIPLVKDIILGHTFSKRPASPIEAVLFHDADILDFMGFHRCDAHPVHRRPGRLGAGPSQRGRPAPLLHPGNAAKVVDVSGPAHRRGPLGRNGNFSGGIGGRDTGFALSCSRTQ